MYIVEKRGGEISSLAAKELKGGQVKAISSPLAQRILRLLAKEPLYPKAVAKRLKENEQTIYYHIRMLEEAKIIHMQRQEVVKGAKANIYALTQQAFVFRFSELETTQKLAETGPSLLEPFIEDGRLNARIIVGSPDPHGPQKARSRDGYYAIDLALFLGTYLHYVPSLNVRLDTEAREEDLQENLILIGGPIVNTVTARVNKSLPVRFDEEDNLNIHSTITGKVYRNDENGIIVKTKSPFNTRKMVMVVAGKRHAGTRAVMIAFMKDLPQIMGGNKKDPQVIAKVVEGIDLDSDGIVDSVEFLE